MKPPEDGIAIGELISRYEQMRQGALGDGGSPGPRRWGVALLMQQGMAAWLLAQRQPPAAREPLVRQCQPVSPCAPGASELIGVLAAVILNNCWEQRHAR